MLCSRIYVFLWFFLLFCIISAYIWCSCHKGVLVDYTTNTWFCHWKTLPNPQIVSICPDCPYTLKPLYMWGENEGIRDCPSSPSRRMWPIPDHFIPFFVFSFSPSPSIICIWSNNLEDTIAWVDKWGFKADTPGYCLDVSASKWGAKFRPVGLEMLWNSQ